MDQPLLLKLTANIQRIDARTLGFGRRCHYDCLQMGSIEASVGRSKTSKKFVDLSYALVGTCLD